MGCLFFQFIKKIVMAIKPSAEESVSEINPLAIWLGWVAKWLITANPVKNTYERYGSTFRFKTLVTKRQLR